MKSERKREIASKIDVIVTGKVAKRKSQCEISQELEKEEILKKEFDKIDVCKDITLAVNISTSKVYISDAVTIIFLITSCINNAINTTFQETLGLKTQI